MAGGASTAVTVEQVCECLWCSSRDLAPEIAGAQDWFFGAISGSFDFSRCADCGSLVLRNRPVKSDIGKAYEGYYTRAESDAAANGQAYAGFMVRLRDKVKKGYSRYRYSPDARLLDQLAATPLALLPRQRLAVDCWYRFLPAQPSRVLDYGCGNGAFMARAAALGHDVVGVDLDETALSQARQRGLKVRHVTEVSGKGFDAQFDMITANHVIEHVPDPVDLLIRLHRWLKPGGKIYLECPNADAAGLRRFAQFWRGLEAPRHFSLPSRTALTRALVEAGFGSIKWYERSDVAAAMDRHSAKARHGHPDIALQDDAWRFQDGPEFLTLVAHRNG